MVLLFTVQIQKGYCAIQPFAKLSTQELGWVTEGCTRLFLSNNLCLMYPLLESKPVFHTSGQGKRPFVQKMDHWVTHRSFQQDRRRSLIPPSYQSDSSQLVERNQYLPGKIQISDCTRDIPTDI
jgi:hypothetical protein